MNVFVYAPKHDPYHRFRWEVLYPREEMRRFRELGELARKSGGMFSIAISPGNSFRPEDKKHQRLLMRKLLQFAEVGCTFFPILYDDLNGFTKFDTPEAAGHAERQGRMMNGYVEAMAKEVKGARFLFCPTEYGTAEKSPYLTRLHEVLDPRVEVICTGVDGPGYQIFAKTLSNAGAEKYVRNFGRKPLFWDNFNTSDWKLDAMHWSAYEGRGSRLAEFSAGILVNPQNVYRLNWPLFGAVGDYFRDPKGFRAKRSQRKYLVEELGEAGGKVGVLLAKWYTNEMSKYVSSAMNLPALPESGRPSTALLKEIRRVVKPLMTVADRMDVAPLSPEWAGEIAAYAHTLQWWGATVDMVCEAGLKGDGKERRPELGNKVVQPKGYGERLPGSLVGYLAKLFERVTE
jgi:hyaluronoglucosaminidase